VGKEQIGNTFKFMRRQISGGTSVVFTQGFNAGVAYPEVLGQ